MGNSTIVALMGDFSRSESFRLTQERFILKFHVHSLAMFVDHCLSQRTNDSNLIYHYLQ